MLHAPIPHFDHQQRIDALRSLSFRCEDPILAVRLRRLADGLEKRPASAQARKETVARGELGWS